jgi:2-hydroxychromene-2-carboxylate isomerase
MRAAGLRRFDEATAMRTAAQRLSQRGVEFIGNVHSVQALLAELERAVDLADTLAELVEESGQVVVDGDLTPLAKAMLAQRREAANQARDAARLGLDTARLTRDQATVTAKAFERAMRASGLALGPDQRDQLAEAFATELRLEKYATEPPTLEPPA